VLADRFGESPPFSVGLEEELFVLDGETLEPASVPAGVLDGARFKAELFTTMLELTTAICTDVPQAVEELAELRLEARRLLREHGLELAAAGTWPTAVLGEQPVTQLEPLQRFAEYAGPSALRQHCAGLHVHVGVATPEECMGRLESVLPFLPAVLAVSANSPYAGGVETGLASTRAELLALLPRAGAPPAFAGYEDFVRFAELLVELGLADDLMRLWWDVRPHPRLGTLEIRAPDQPTRLADTAALAELCRSLVVAADPGAEPADRGLYAQNRWAAARFGSRAGLIHPETRGLAAPHELLAGAGLDGLDQAGEQLEVGRRDGLRALRERLVALTYDQL
jgi:glutamate---cysteine ligase / carboxylate-amine ligase